MKLRPYFAAQPRGAQQRLAAELGVSQSHLSKLASEQCEASLGLALLIEIKTRGKVRAAEVPLSDATRDQLIGMKTNEIIASVGEVA